MDYLDHNTTRPSRSVEQIVGSAIAESIDTNSIVRVDEPGLADAIIDALREECEEDVPIDALGVHEFRGEDCGGATWRVHVVLPSDN